MNNGIMSATSTIVNANTRAAASVSVVLTNQYG